MIDHDRLFKELLTTFFVEFVELFLPETAGYMDRGSISFLDKEVFSDVTSGERHEADLVARVKLRSEEAFFLIHVENQATARPNFARRMFTYFARLHERHGLRVYPVAIFSYDRPLREEPDTYGVAFPDLDVLTFRFRTIQLNRLNWRDYVRRPNPVAAALMSKMQVAPEDRVRVKVQCLRLIATLRMDPAKQQLISGFVDTYLRLTREEGLAFGKELRLIPETDVREQAMQIVTSWSEEGYERGFKEGTERGFKEGTERGIREGTERGIERGMERGKAAVILRQLTRRFGALPAELDSRIGTLTNGALDELADALFDFASLDDVTAWLTGYGAQP
jgi:predicted transposase YdaD